MTGTDQLILEKSAKDGRREPSSSKACPWGAGEKELGYTFQTANFVWLLDLFFLMDKETVARD